MSNIAGFVSVGGTIITPLVKQDWRDFYKVNKFGRNADVDTGAAGEDICDNAVFEWPAAAAATTVVSTSTDDDGDPVGTGARTVEVQGLDGDYNKLTVTATLNGTGAVTLGTQFIRVFRIKVLTAGSGGSNAGTIAVKHSTTVLAQITIGNNQTLMACYTVPTGYTAYMLSYYHSMNRTTTTGAVDMRIWARPFGEVFQLKNLIGLVGAGTGLHNHRYSVAGAYAEKTDIYVDAVVTANDTDISSGFDLLVVKNK